MNTKNSAAAAIFLFFLCSVERVKPLKHRDMSRLFVNQIVKCKFSNENSEHFNMYIMPVMQNIQSVIYNYSYKAKQSRSK